MAQELHISHYLPIDWKRICLIGNRWHHNFGDELIVIGLMKLLLAGYQLPATSYQLFVSGGDLKFLKEFHGYFFSEQELKYINYIQEIPHGIRSGFRFVISHLSSLIYYLKCDTFVIGWGELFTEETPGSYLYRFRSLIPYWIRKIFIWNTKLYVMGWLQKPKAWYNKLILKLILRNANGCFLRDEESVKTATMLRCYDALKDSATMPNKKTYHNIGWFIDTSYFTIFDNDFNLTMQDNSKASQHRSIAASQHSKHIIINTNPLSEKRTEELSDIVRQYHEQGYEIYFLPAFFTRNPAQNDTLCFDLLKSKFDYIQLLDRRKRDEFQIIFLSAEKVFCSRLHIFLVAAFCWLDVKPYAYQKKITKNMNILKKIWILS